MDDRSALLLYDGSCGFCARSVQFVLRHESANRSLRFASLESDVGAEIRAKHPELDSIDSVIWVDPNGTLLVKSRAALRVLSYLGGIWRGLAAVGRIVPLFVRDAVYDFIARHRHQIIRADPSCLLPTPEQRVRFLG